MIKTMDFKLDCMSILSFRTCKPNLKTDKITKNAFILLFFKNSLGRDMHSHEHLLVYVIIIVLLSYVGCGV